MIASTVQMHVHHGNRRADTDTRVSDILPSRSLRLKDATRAVHAKLDQSLMAGDIFASRTHFARFLRVQYRFHRDIQALYASEALAALIPDLTARCRLPKIAHDLASLEQALPAPAAGRLDRHTPAATALGWLYVAEGSNLGASILFKMAQEKLGLDQETGASHLAAHPDGVARHWRAFTAALDAAVLTREQDHALLHAATQAFETVQCYVREEIG